ncbi:MAG: hypothetical protein LBH93_08600 [Chitinispirillales bacterium]|jgi:hypothetical protein|nr:hypothetical protein [Chitinispirillales bacterium]
MKVLVLDDGRGRAEPIKGVFSKKKIDAAVCSASNDFMAAICAPANFEAVYINAETWRKGRCIYEYFGAGSRLASKPAVFYNVDETFSPAIAGRQPHEGDRSFAQPSDIETVVDAL